MLDRAVDEWSWEVAEDAGEVHALLCACDAHQATAAAPAPARNPATTRRRVAAGSVHVLRRGGEAVACFTLTWDPPFEAAPGTFPAAAKPAYLGRLAVRPELLEGGSLAGARCVRRAAEVAAAAGADVLRSEANPDLRDVRSLLAALGFEPCGPVLSDGERRRVHLQKRLVPTSGEAPRELGTAELPGGGSRDGIEGHHTAR